MPTTTTAKDRPLKIAVGALLLGSVVVALLLIWINSTHINPLSETFTLKVAIDHGQGIQQGAPVTLVGIPVGQVDSMQLGRQGKIQMSLKILKSYQANIRADSLVHLIKPVVGIPKLDITLGTELARPLQQGDSIALKKQAVFDEIIATLPEKMKVVDSILNNLNHLTLELADSDGPFRKSLLGINATAQNFNQLSSQAVTLVTTMNATAKHIDNLSQQGEQILANIENGSKDLPKMSQQLQTILAEITTLSSSLKNIAKEVESSRTDFPNMIRQVRDTAASADELLRAIKTTPLLKPAFPPPNTQTIIETPRDEHL